MGCRGSLHNKIKPHVVVFPYPLQGHINPLMEFAKRLVSTNAVGVTFVVTEPVKKRMLQAQDAAQPFTLPNIRLETIPNGLSPELENSKDRKMKLHQLCHVGGPSFEKLIMGLMAQGEKVCCIVFDSFGLDWVSQIAKKFNIPSAFFWTQSCAVYSIYYHYTKGLMKVGEERGIIEIPGLPQFRPKELPTFLLPSNSDEVVSRQALLQFKTMLEATWVLGNSFYELETQENKSMEYLYPIRTVGPLVPSSFLEGNNASNTELVAHLWKAANCMEWLSTKKASTVVYVSFGSLTVMSKEQMEEIALGLKLSGFSFLSVVRPDYANGESSPEDNLPEGFVEETMEKGLVVPWCPQMQVLSHPSVGVFMTHCGWNSTLEGLSCGVPMLTLPQWSDQMTNAKYVEEVWKSGIRLKRRADGITGREEVEKSIRTVMETEVGVGIRKNALRWKTIAREAMMDGGSSSRNIKDFVNEVTAKAYSMSVKELAGPCAENMVGPNHIESLQ